MTGMAPFVAGLLTAGFLVIGVFFLRFWARTGDHLFAAFAAAFWLLAAGQAAVALMGLPEEDRSGLYLLRLSAFALIIGAILVKNLRGRRRR